MAIDQWTTIALATRGANNTLFSPCYWPSISQVGINGFGKEVPETLRNMFEIMAGGSSDAREVF